LTLKKSTEFFRELLKMRDDRQKTDTSLSEERYEYDHESISRISIETRDERQETCQETFFPSERI